MLCGYHIKCTALDGSDVCQGLVVKMIIFGAVSPIKRICVFDINKLLTLKILCILYVGRDGYYEVDHFVVQMRQFMKNVS